MIDAADPPRQCERQRRLAARGRPCDKHRLPGEALAFTAWPIVATLISNPSGAPLDDAALAHAAAALPQAQAPLGSTPRHRRRHHVRRRRRARAPSPSRSAQRWRAEPVDVVVQPARGRRKRLFLADMDSTMIGQECIDELADLVGMKTEVAAITERAMRGEIAFEPALRERVALLKGLPDTVIDEVIAQAHHADARRPHAGRHHAGEWRLYLPRLRRLHAVHRHAIAAHDRLRRERAATACWSRTASSPATSPSRSSAARQRSRPCIELRARLGLGRGRNAWRSATAPTIST